jgi:hypothetical protein
MTSNGADCPQCRGRGWKFFTLRRAPGNAGAASERELLLRSRVSCLACSGSGRSPS